MLVSSGNEPVRVQCAFIDTPEIEELTEFIGSQKGYADAMHLPEYVDDSESGVLDVDLRKEIRCLMMLQNLLFSISRVQLHLFRENFQSDITGQEELLTSLKLQELSDHSKEAKQEMFSVLIL